VVGFCFCSSCIVMRDPETLEEIDVLAPSRFWGLIGGGGLGFAIGGPIGALIGAIAGHALVDYEGAPLGPTSKQVIFTTGLVALAAKMARSDGVVTRDEIEAFRRIIDVRDDELAHVERLFDLAKETTDGFEAYARQIAEAFADDGALRADVLDGLFHIAAADGAIHEAEEDYLRIVGRILGLEGAAFDAIEARHVRRRDDPYAVLGVSRVMTTDEIKARYRELVREYHPDRQIARGLPPEAIRIATSQMALFNAAWSRIEAERGQAARSNDLAAVSDQR
jgi:DnaJ like chaperone protein